MSVNKRFKSDIPDLETTKNQEPFENIENNLTVISNYFAVPENAYPQNYLQNIPPPIPDICSSFLISINNLSSKLRDLEFSRPVECVYNPTEYAYDVFKNYIHTYCNNFKHLMFLGMNPGPWGMSQTGVPFGEINAVRDWLKLGGNISKPEREVKTRPVLGFDCQRSEISGKRFWSLIQELCGTPENFFRSSFVHNYCPLQLMTESGKNVTPAELKAAERATLFSLCDASLIEAINIFNVNIIVCIGRFVETRVVKLLKTAKFNHDVKVLMIPHPSPRTLGNNNWQEKTIKVIETLQLMPYFQQPPDIKESINDNILNYTHAPERSVINSPSLPYTTCAIEREVTAELNPYFQQPSDIKESTNYNTSNYMHAPERSVINSPSLPYTTYAIEREVTAELPVAGTYFEL